MRIRNAVLFLMVFSWPAARGVAAEPDPAEVEFFEKNVRPVLVEHCFRCHSAQAKKLKGGLRLDSRADIVKGGDSGPAIAPKESEKSRLLEAIRYENVDLQMPPAGKLSAKAIADLTAWVKMGAPWPGKVGNTADAGQGFDLEQRKRAHWCWQPVRPQKVPVVNDATWAGNDVDRFILARLEAKGLKPAPQAERRVLIRRLYFDLIGLPPSQADVAAFVNDAAPEAYRKVVDGLLSSPHFGERWARHWLDLVRYGESRGHEFDYNNPNAYQYRDYVIRAFNADIPYDQFVTEHLAGDLLPKPRLHPQEGFNESILGTGFWFLGEQVHSPVDICQDKADRFDNMLDVMGKTFLGLTVACARCHDHKFDAISTKDYYALFGFLESSSYRLARFDSMEHNRHIAKKIWSWRERSRLPIQRAIADSLRPGLARMADYLLASRDGTPDTAKKLGLDPVLLEKWSAHLVRASKDANDPLHGWARLAGKGASLSDSLRPLVEDAQGRLKNAANALNGASIIVDYRKVDPATWMPDGVAFGPGPARPGDVQFSSDPHKPLARVFTVPAAEKDPLWDRQTLAPGTEGDPGSLGRANRYGRVIRTPSFQVSGNVYYLVKGTGQAYASVDGHVMIAGPLHGQLVRVLKTPPGFHWIEHNLTAYKGRLGHIEFAPEGNSDFAVAMVVQSDRMPGPIDRPNQLVLETLTDAKSATELAQSYQRLFEDVVDRLASDRVVGSADRALLADWLVQHQDLFAPNPSGVEKVAGPLLAVRDKLVGQIKWQSRLALAMLDGTGVDEHVFIRGSYKTPGAVVPRRFLEALSGSDKLPVTRGSGRLELARQITDPANPFLARVMVNRLWHHLFGRGLVASVDNFGVLGEAPRHPELLDYLADRFIKEGWSIKKMIRLVVLSRTYQMSSRPDSKAQQADPQNLLVHCMPIRRLEGEAIRDSMLAVSGRLDDRLYGPSVPVYLTSFQEGRGRPASGPLDGNGRRSLYLSVRRNFLPAMLLAFDTPIPFSTVGRRTVSNVPAQALILLNDPFVHQQADLWAKKVLTSKAPTRERITSMYEAAFGRPPTEAELASCVAFLESQARLNNGTVDSVVVWKDLAHVLFNAKEFIFLQ